MNNSLKYSSTARVKEEQEPTNDDEGTTNNNYLSNDNKNHDDKTKKEKKSDSDDGNAGIIKLEEGDDDDSEKSNKNIHIKNDESQDKVNGSDDDSEDEDDDDDEDEFYSPPEPDYSRANNLPFNSLCQRFEKLWLLRRSKADAKSSKINRANNKGKRIKPNVSKDEMLENLLPAKMKEHLDGGSPFPCLRLMVPDLDTLRPHLGMKELTIGKIWGEAIGLVRNSKDHKKLIEFTNPISAGPTACGDLSLAVYEVMQKRFPQLNRQNSDNKSRSTDKNGKKKKTKKGITIGDMNQLLDELAMIKKQVPTSTSQSQSSQSQTQLSSQPQSSQSQQSQSSISSLNSKGAGSIKSKHLMRVRWVEKLIKLGLSPLEHKWIVRIILQKLELGVGSDSIINFYHPWAQDLYAANKNIRSLCATLCDKEYVERRKIQLEREKKLVDNHNR